MGSSYGVWCPRAPQSQGPDTCVPEQRPRAPAVPLEPALPSRSLQQTKALVSAIAAPLQRASHWKEKPKNQVFRDLTTGHTFWPRNEGS